MSQQFPLVQSQSSLMSVDESLQNYLSHSAWLHWRGPHANWWLERCFSFSSLFSHLMELYVHTKKKEQSSSEHMYHVLEGPTPVESAPETQEQEVCTQYMGSYSTCTQTFKRTICELKYHLSFHVPARVQRTDNRYIFHFTLWWTRLKRKRRQLCRLGWSS